MAGAEGLMGDQIQKMLGTAVYAVYEGSALHKTEPFKSGPDATLVTPAWHEDKTPCENEAYPNSTESTARKLLLKGLQRRMVDAGFAEDLRSGSGRGFPKHIWAVYNDKHAFEANCSARSKQPVYHGYPLPEWDPMREVVLKMWRERRPA